MQQKWSKRGKRSKSRKSGATAKQGRTTSGAAARVRVIHVTAKYDIIGPGRKKKRRGERLRLHHHLWSTKLFAGCGRLSTSLVGVGSARAWWVLPATNNLPRVSPEVSGSRGFRSGREQGAKREQVAHIVYTCVSLPN